MNPQAINIDAYDYPLPQQRIAQHPLAQRDACRLLVYHAGQIADARFRDIVELLPADTALVYNDTRVINARLHFRRATGALIEIFCLEPAAPADYAQNFAQTASTQWICLVGNLKKWKEESLQAQITLPSGEVSTLTATRVGTHGNAWVVRFDWTGGHTFADIIGAAGEIPIPPYLNRDTEECDSSDYQTVYSHIDGSVAAPTAGLHFTDELLQAISGRGIPRWQVTLHVGAGTFQPVKSELIGDHPMHSEFIAVPLTTIRHIAAHIAAGRTITAVGTTSVRTLESLYHIGCLMATDRWTGEVPQWYPYAPEHPQLCVSEAFAALIRRLESDGMSALVAATRIIIAPGYQYRVVSGMITNFHQPRSTLLLLVSAFVGDANWRPIYDHALATEGYRFLSYGDACYLRP